MKLIEKERNVMILQTQKRVVNEKIDSLRKSGKPFYWVDHERLRKLKKLCDSERFQEENFRKQAVSALYEYKDTVNNYNR